jgi:hypothetical protein
VLSRLTKSKKTSQVNAPLNSPKSHFCFISAFHKLWKAIFVSFQPSTSCGKPFLFHFSLPQVVESHFCFISAFRELPKTIFFQFQRSQRSGKALFFRFSVPSVLGRHYFFISAFRHSTGDLKSNVVNLTRKTAFLLKL